MEIKEIKIDVDGFFDTDEIERIARNKNAKLITLSHALYNNGAIMPVEEIGKIARDNNVLVLHRCGSNRWVNQSRCKENRM